MKVDIELTTNIEIIIANGYSLPDGYADKIEKYREWQQEQMGSYLKSLVTADDEAAEAYARAMKVL